MYTNGLEKRYFWSREANERQIRLLEFANSYKLTVTNTLVLNKLSRRTTRHSANIKIHNHIDFVLKARRSEFSIEMPRTSWFHEADIVSDHGTLLMTLQHKKSYNKISCSQ